jgi:hypothetical protein
LVYNRQRRDGEGRRRVVSFSAIVPNAIIATAVSIEGVAADFDSREI